MSGSLNDLVRQARELLRFQGELGLDGLDVPAEILSPRLAMSLPASDPVGETPNQPSAAPAPGHAASLPEIAQELADCTRCKLCEKRTHIVFGVGNPEARLMFIGEGPGRDEDLRASRSWAPPESSSIA
jgi:DNA polymerase